MKAAIGCLIGLIFGVGASAEPVLEGQVRLASGEVIASAQVQVFDMTDLQRGAVAQATTDERGYFALPLAGLPGLVLPKRFELGSNYPNPFNPSTLIPYQLAASSYVRLEVFNLLGQRLATLVDGERPAGVHTAVWDATDGSGQAVGAGVYLYRLTVGGEHRTGRMVLVDGQAGVSAVGGEGVWPVGVAPDGSYGLVVSGSGIAPYVVADLGIQAGMAPMELVVAAHPAGKVLDDDDFSFDLSDLFNTPAEEEDDDALVSIPDANLRAAIETALGKASGAPITKEDMATLTRLDARNKGIRSLTGLEFATNLTWLDLGGEDVGGEWLNSNEIADLSPLSGLTSLTYLDLYGNSFSDISVLSSLTNLTGLGLGGNGLSDISILSSLTNLTLLYLDGNNLSDLSPLVANTGLGSGDEVELWGNPLSCTSLNTHIPALQSRGVTVHFDGSGAGSDDDCDTRPNEDESETDSTASQGGPDLIVLSASASLLTLTAGQAFTLHVTVQNQGDEPSAATTLRYYRSNNATITSSDTEAGTDAVGALNASATSTESIGLTAPTSARTYYYGACVESVSGESDTDNNCSQAVTITVSGSSSTSGERQASPLDVIVADRFGRAVNGTGITLVDWEGYIANPAMKYTVKAPSGVTTTRVILSSSEQRVYFNLPSWNGAEGPRKELNLSGTSSQAEFYISIFPDRDGLDETHSLTIEYRDTKSRRHTQSIDIHVIDQDVPNRALDFDITVDLSHDKTDLFDDQGAREDVVQAAEDWMYFFDDMDLDEVPAGQEQSWIESLEGWPKGDAVWNKESYTGFLLYAYGARSTGGGPSWKGGYQSANGETLPLKRSGDIAMQKSGNWGTGLGWLTAVPDEEWWKATNLEGPHDFYSIALHEIGHALAFNPGYPVFSKFKDLGYIKDATIRDYYGKYPAISPGVPDHLPGTIDTVSRRGAYGGEYDGEMPQGRWLVTKGHLLIAEAIGYILRATSPFIPLSITAASLPEGTSGTSYSYTATVSGGTPAYHWSIESGTLPEGLSIDSFTGTISGTPSQQGTFNFTLSVSDCDETTPSITRAVTLRIRE